MPQKTNTRPIAPSTRPATHPLSLSWIVCSMVFAFLKARSCSRDAAGGRARTLGREMAEWTGLEPATPGVTGRYSNQLNYHSACWWVLRGSNPRPSPCKGDALPAELSTPLEEARKCTRGIDPWLAPRPRGASIVHRHHQGPPRKDHVRRHEGRETGETARESRLRIHLTT